MAEPPPSKRTAVRAVLLDAQNRVLLFRAYADSSRRRSFWITPGGGVDPGEADWDALRRELAEECGIQPVNIGKQVWIRDATFEHPVDGRPIQQHERFYLVRVQNSAINTSGWDDFERAFTGEHRWWTINELKASNEDFAPNRLRDLVEPLVNGDLPDEPIDVGR